MAKSPLPYVFSHWHKLFENFETSSQGFYRSLEAAIENRGISKVDVYRVDFYEGGPASANREYLRVRRKGLTFDICGALSANMDETRTPREFSVEGEQGVSDGERDGSQDERSRG
jgi:hypothetical protein